MRVRRGTPVLIARVVELLWLHEFHIEATFYIVQRKLRE